MNIRKAVIPAAGLGTRFLPATKAQPKEMLPIVDKPAIQYIVEEAVRSGIESIIIVTGRGKKSMEDHFDKSVELEQLLEDKGKHRLLEEVRAISDMASIHFIRQKEPLGLGHAILCAKQFIGDEPFAVLLGDDIMVSEPPALSGLIDLYGRTGRQVVGVREVPEAEVSKYGIIRPAAVDASGSWGLGGAGMTLRSGGAAWPAGGVCRVGGLVEKPAAVDAPSNMAVMGRYVLKPEIFPVLERLERGAGGEYQLTDALHAMCAEEELLALTLGGERYDIGDKIGYMKAIIEVGLKREELRGVLLPYLRELVSKEAAGGRV